MAIVPTIKVNYLQGKYVAFINVSDFDPQIHEIYVEPAPQVIVELKKQVARAVDVEPVVEPVDEAAAEVAAQAEIDAEKVARRAASLVKAREAAVAAKKAAKEVK